MTLRDKRRKTVNVVMLSLCALCALVTVSTLFVILGFLLYNGITSLSLSFFTKLPLPPGQTGGGMGNAIVGSAQIVLVATVIGLPRRQRELREEAEAERRDPVVEEEAKDHEES